MTDTVQINLERMIPELEDYKKRGIFTEDEIQKIIQTRRKHEFRINRYDKKLVDILRYIESEVNLERIRDSRYKKIVNELDRKYYFNNRISKRIVKLYKEALYRWNNKEILIMFTEYAIRKKMVFVLKDVYSQYCLKHSSDTDLWIYCAVKLFQVGNIDSSRALFTKGIRLFKSSSRLRIEFFKMEIQNIIQSKETLEIDEVDKETVEVAWQIYIDIVETFKDEDIKQKLLNMSKEVDELYKKCLQI